MKQCASTVTALPFVLRDRLWLVFILMLSLLTPPEARAEYAPDENNNPIWAGADAEPAEVPDWSDDEGDSVPNWLENHFETATWLADTDSDGLSDWDEVFGTGTNPVLWDTNGNGLSDADDLIQPPDAGDMPPQPTADDFDGDGLPDLWELAYALNAYDPSDAAADPDGDFILNIEEYQHGTDPQVADDYTTVMGYPIDTASLSRQDDGTERDADWDGDGISNLTEIQNASDPRISDNNSGGPTTNSDPQMEEDSVPDSTNNEDAEDANPGGTSSEETEAETIVVSGTSLAAWSEYQDWNINFEVSIFDPDLSISAEWVTIASFGSSANFWGGSDQFGPPPGYEWFGAEETSGEVTSIIETDYEWTSLPNVKRWLRWETHRSWTRTAKKK